MKATFACATCGGAVGYDLVAVETHELRQYGVNHYECKEPCQTCEAKAGSTAVPVVSAAHEPIVVPGFGHGFQPEDASLPQQRAGITG